MTTQLFLAYCSHLPEFACLCLPDETGYLMGHLKPPVVLCQSALTMSRTSVPDYPHSFHTDATWKPRTPPSQEHQSPS